MMRALLIVAALVLVGAAAPELAAPLITITLLLGVVWIGVLQMKWSIIKRYRGGRR